MSSAPTLTMSKREFERAVLMRRVHERRLMQAAAAALLGLSQRQTERLYQKYRTAGPSALASRKRGRPSNRRMSGERRSAVLVKELRLRAISSIEAANAYAPEFIATYNARFAKKPRNDFDVHRPLLQDENLEDVFCWRELRKVSNSLSINYQRRLYLLEDTDETRALAGRSITVVELRDGHRARSRRHAIVRGDGIRQRRCAHFPRIHRVQQAPRRSLAAHSGLGCSTTQFRCARPT
jgi:hypothetical protein